VAESDLDRIIPLAYAELRRLADVYLRGERPGHTLQPTALVHEAYLRLREQHVEWQNPGQVLGIAARQMRRILVDHARARNRQKRGGGEPLLVVDDIPDKGVDIMALDEALSDLARLDERQAGIVELRYFGGLSVEETAAALEISPATVHREWAMAKAWLRQALAGGGAHDT